MKRIFYKTAFTAAASLMAFFFFSCAVVNLEPENQKTPDPVDDGTPPVPGGSGNLLTMQVLGQSIRLAWAKSSDPGSAPVNLEYMAVQSLSGDIDSVSNALTNGQVVMNWTSDVDFCPITNLSPWTEYYFNVLVRDEWGNTANYTMKSRTTADSNDNYLPDPSFEFIPLATNWNYHWITGGSGVQHQSGVSHIRTGIRGIYTYTDMMSSLENFTRLDHYDSTWKSRKVSIPWNPGESARAWIWYKIWTSIGDSLDGNYYIKVIFYSNNTKLAEHETRAFSNLTASTWETNNMTVITPPAPAKTQYAEVAFGIWKANGIASQYRASFDDVFISVVTN